MRIRAPFAVLVCLLGVVALPAVSRAATPPNRNDPCAGGTRNACGTAGTGYFGGVSVPTASSRSGSYPKAALPTGVWSRKGRARLVLVTCGGPFDQKTSHYRDNVIVTAVPA